MHYVLLEIVGLQLQNKHEEEKKCSCKVVNKSTCKGSSIAYPTCITRKVLEECFGSEGIIDNQGTHGMYFKIVEIE